jgi:hypothetical protein
MCGIYNNFCRHELFPETRRQSFSSLYRTQIYRRCLRISKIHSMVVYGFAAQDRVHRFLDFTYEHRDQNQTDGCLIWGGIRWL